MYETQQSGSNNVGKIILAIVVGFIILKTCNISKDERQPRSSTSTTTSQKWQKSPLDNLIKSLSDEPNFTIILFDMDANDPSIGKAVYKHQYKVLLERPDTVETRETAWNTVSEAFFQQHINDMGMEIASKKDNVVHKQVAPAGYSNYVGNEKYGQWRERNGSSFWEFYGKYAFMSSMFNMMAYPARRSYYNDYRNGGYYGSSRSYYGPSGQRVYGTHNYASNTGNTRKSTWGQKSSSFKQSVNSRVSRSTTTSKSRTYSSSNKYSNNNKTTRSSSRSSSSSSYRSRGGGSGK